MLAGAKSDNLPVFARPLRCNAVALRQSGKEHVPRHAHLEAFAARYVADNHPVTIGGDFRRVRAPRNPVRHRHSLIPFPRAGCDTLVNSVNGAAEIIRVNERLGPQVNNWGLAA